MITSPAAEKNRFAFSRNSENCIIGLNGAVAAAFAWTYANQITLVDKGVDLVLTFGAVAGCSSWD